MTERPSSERPAPRSPFALPASVLLVAAIALLVSEMTVRALRAAPDVQLIDVEQQGSVYKRSTNPVLGFELKADWRDPDADLVTSYPSTNSWGQRDVERTLEKPAGVRRIVVLGESVVEGFGIRDLDDTITRRLERLYGDGTEVLNFGVSAYCTRAKVELLRVKGLAFRPDEVVLFFTQNDFNNFNHEAFALGSPVDRPAAVDWLFVRSHAFRFFCTKLDLFHFRAQVDPVAWNREAIGDDNVTEGLRLLRELADEHGFRTLVAIWPRFTDEDIVDTNSMPDGPELVVERLAAMYGHPSFRLSDAFRMHRAALGERVNPRVRYTLGDHIHPNPEGTWIAAVALKGELDVLHAGGPEPAPAAEDAAALAEARRLGEVEPQSHRIVVNLGNTLLQQGRYDEAIERYREALAMKPDLAEAHANWGLALKAKGDLPGAIARTLEALRIDPELAEAHYNLGVALAATGRLDDAAKAFRRAVELRPGFDAAERALAAVGESTSP
ncbi:MAG: tetratricopeptide repeat protein [Candidatus Eiseniibacteriota bacterium]